MWPNGQCTTVLVLVLCYSSSATSLSSKCFADPFVTGGGYEKLLRWSFNVQWGACTPFVFGGGTDGTDNNFLTKPECVEACMGSNGTNIVRSEAPSARSASDLTGSSEEEEEEGADEPKGRLPVLESFDSFRQTPYGRCYDLAVGKAPIKNYPYSSDCRDRSKYNKLCSASYNGQLWTFDMGNRTCRKILVCQYLCSDTHNKYTSISECEKYCVRRDILPANFGGRMTKITAVKTQLLSSEESSDKISSRSVHQNFKLRSSVSDWYASCSDYPVWVVDRLRRSWYENNDQKSQVRQSGYSYCQHKNKCVFVKDIVKSPTLNKFYTKHECKRCKAITLERKPPCESSPQLAPRHYCSHKNYRHHFSEVRWAFFDGKCVPYKKNVCGPKNNAWKSKSSCYAHCKPRHSHKHDKRHHHKLSYKRGLYFFRPYKHVFSGLFFYYLPLHFNSNRHHFWHHKKRRHHWNRHHKRHHHHKW